jgi:flagellar assembly factor FliW
MNAQEAVSIPSYLFGAIPAPADRVLYFDAGILGFPTHRRWLLLEGARPGTAWLQSADQDTLAFMLVDPFVVFDAFTVDLTQNELRRLDAANPSDVLVFSLVTLPLTTDASATANLQGPLVINVRARRGVQMIIEGNRWRVREPFAITALPAAQQLQS